MSVHKFLFILTFMQKCKYDSAFFASKLDI